MLSTFSFLFGGLSDRSICFYLENVTDPQSERIISLVQNEFQNGLFENYPQIQDIKPVIHYLKNVKIVDILNRCHQNKSLFEVLQLSFDQKIQIYKNNEFTYFKLSDVVLFKEVLFNSEVSLNK